MTPTIYVRAALWAGMLLAFGVGTNCAMGLVCLFQTGAGFVGGNATSMAPSTAASLTVVGFNQAIVFVNLALLWRVVDKHHSV